MTVIGHSLIEGVQVPQADETIGEVGHLLEVVSTGSDRPLWSPVLAEVLMNLLGCKTALLDVVDVSARDVMA